MTTPEGEHMPTITREAACAFVAWANRVAGTSPLRTAVTEIRATGEIVGITIRYEGRSISQGVVTCCPLGDGLASWSDDSDGNSYYSAGTGDHIEPSTGTLRSRWAENAEFSANLAERVIEAMEADPA
jgi:hypothetical protein